MLEALFSLLIVSILLSLLLMYLQGLRRMDTSLYDGEDDISISQLRLIYVLSDTCYADGSLYLSYYDKDMQVSLQKDRLIMQPGYQVFLQDVDDAYFTQREECIYLVYKHKKQEIKERIIGC
ncbi:hypothetical protein [Breznakia blatticola]|nr:hypothetical protein [Breznakia blatticola]